MPVSRKTQIQMVGGPFMSKEVFPHGVVELTNEDDTNAFKVNGQQVKPYYEGDIDSAKVFIDLEKFEWGKLDSPYIYHDHIP